MNNFMPINLKTYMKCTNSFKNLTLLILIEHLDVLLQTLKKFNTHVQKNFPSKKAPSRPRWFCFWVQPNISGINSTSLKWAFSALLYVESAVYVTDSKINVSVLPLSPILAGRQLEDHVSDKVAFSTAWSIGLNDHSTSKI